MYFEARSKHQLRQCASVVCVGKYYTGQLAAADPVCFRVIPRAECGAQGEEKQESDQWIWPHYYYYMECVMCMGSKRLIDYMLLAHHIILCIVQLVLKDLTFQISNNGRTC